MFAQQIRACNPCSTPRAPRQVLIHHSVFSSLFSRRFPSPSLFLPHHDLCRSTPSSPRWPQRLQDNPGGLIITPSPLWRKPDPRARHSKARAARSTADKWAAATAATLCVFKTGEWAAYLQSDSVCFAQRPGSEREEHLKWHLKKKNHQSESIWSIT